MPVIRLLVLSSLALLLAACQKPAASDAPASAAGAAASAATVSAPAEAALATASTTAPTPPALGEFRIVSVAMGKALAEDGGVVGDSSVFAPKDTLYAAVLSTGKHQGLSLSAKWSTAGGVPIAVTRQALVPQAPTATVFKIGNPDGWPPGKYQVVIAADDYPLQTREFEVR